MPDAPVLLRDHLCLGCACLCDDLNVVVAGRTVVEVENACPVGRKWLQTETARASEQAGASVDGRPVAVSEAVATAAARLKASRAPLILISNVTCEVASEAVGLADRVRGMIDLDAPDDLRSLDFARDGAVTATLSEIRHRSDLIVYWGVDPNRYPRHRERYAPDRPGRTVLVIAEPQGIDSTQAFSLLRMIVSGGSPPNVPDWLRKLADRLLSVRHGAFFFGEPNAEGMRLVRDLNRGRRFVGLTMGDSRNEGGIEAALTWTAGAPRSVDFSLGHPRFLPGEAVRRRNAGEYDYLIAIGDVESPPEADLRIAPGASGTKAAVAIDVGRAGIDDAGTILRTDGVALPARPLFATDRPSAGAILRAVNDRLDAEDRRP